MGSVILGTIIVAVVVSLWWNNYHKVDVEPPDEFYIWQEGDSLNEAADWQKRRNYEKLHEHDGNWWMIVPGLIVFYIVAIIVMAN